ncbi:MAG: SpoIIE family protein phosphatase, partial [Cyanobacteria bacterium P01_F01_bin.42]
PDSQYQNAIATIPSGGTLYVFSDGVYEFPDHGGQIWGLSAFKSVIQQVQTEQLPLDALLQQLRRSCASPKFMDDLSLLRVSFNGAKQSNAETP